MKLHLSVDQLSSKAITAMGNLQTAIAARQTAESNLAVAQKKEEQALAQLKALGIHLTGIKEGSVKPLEITPPEGMLTARQAAVVLGLAYNTISKLTEKGDLVVAERIRSSRGSRINLFRAVDVEALRMKRSLALRLGVIEQRPGTVEQRPGTVEQSGAARGQAVSKPIPTPATAPSAPAAPPVPPTPKPVAVSNPAPVSKRQPASFDVNEEGRLAMVDEGKARFRDRVFYIARISDSGRYLWDCLPSPQVSGDWELVEEWRKNGLGRWESTPAIPGAVGSHVLTASNGPKQGSLV